MDTRLILTIYILTYPRNRDQVTGLKIPYMPTTKGCGIQNTTHETSLNLCCSKCAPGTFKLKSCSRVEDTLCQECPAGSYTEYWNDISQCFSCRGNCKAEHGLIELQDCTATTRRVCVCRQGTYCQTGTEQGATTCSHCLPHSACAPGLGVAMPGNYSANTICRPCPPGTFSNVTSTSHRCETHTNCSMLGRVTTRPGNATMDTGCSDQEDRSERRLALENTASSSNLLLAVPCALLFLIVVILMRFSLSKGFHQQRPLQLACFKKVFKSCTTDPEVQDSDYKSLEVTRAELLRTTDVPSPQNPPTSDPKVALETETNQERPCNPQEGPHGGNIPPHGCGSEEEAGRTDTAQSVKLEDVGTGSKGIIGPVYIYNPSRVYVGVIGGNRDLQRSLQGRDETSNSDATLGYPEEEQGTCEREVGEFPQQECGKDSHISESVSDRS